MVATIATPVAAAGAPIRVGPPTLASLAIDVKLDPELATALWEHLGVDPADDAEVAAAIPRGILDDSMEAFRVARLETALPVTAGVSGRVSLLFSKLRSAFAPPPAQPLVPEAAAVVDLPVVVKGKVSAVLDQADEGMFEALDPSKRAEYRSNHLLMTGGAPPEGRIPSSDQMAALASKLAKQEAPYADFAVFTPAGRRLHKLRKFEAQVFIDGELKTRSLRGPSDFQSWKASWAVFRAAMISIGALSPSTLDGYERGIETLVAMFPTHWGVIYCADEILRSEHWQVLAEELQDAGAWPDDLPWDKVVRLSTFGGGDSTFRMSHWWKLHAEAPCQRAGSAVAFLQQIEGTKLLPMPEGMTSSSAAAAPRDAGSAGRAPKKRKQTPSSSSSFGAPAWQPTQDKGWSGSKGGGGKGKGKDEGKGKGRGKSGGKKGPTK